MSQHSIGNEGNDNKSESARSRSTRTSGTSSTKISMAVAMAKAKAEAAQARAAHSQKEIELKVEQACIQANLDALDAEKEKDAAIAEANALLANLEDVSFEVRSAAGSLTLQSTKVQRVASYVSEQASLSYKSASSKRESDNASPTHYSRHSQPHVPTPTSQLANSSQAQAANPSGTARGQDPQTFQISVAPPQQERNQPFNYSPTLQPRGGRSQQSFKMDPPSPAFQSAHRASYGASQDNPASTRDLIKYLARSHLVTSGLTVYDEQPMNYWAWKSSFRNAIADLDLSEAEELDLLIKHLGKESAEQVRRIRTVNIRDQITGLCMAWERLDEVYGSPEAVEQALFNKLEHFPKLTTKDPQRLRDLADLLSELQAAKEDGYLAGLSYLDTSRGIRPILEKLPYNLQEKWLYFGTRYKQEHMVTFPPFHVLVNFISTEARARTDPSFNFFTQAQAPAERKSKWERPARTSVYVHKTQVSGSTKFEPRESREQVDPNKHCPLHKKPHPLKKCRGFREKNLNERKQLLKDYRICFRCCSSTEHLAKNCTAEIKCAECDSTAHATALHPDAPTWKSKSPPPTPDDGGEGDEVDSQEVNSACTQVCGKGLSARACAKICLVSVFPNGCREKSKRVYAILDEQSNRSLARSEFFEAFNISGSSYSYTLKTCLITGNRLWTVLPLFNVCSKNDHR